MSTTTPPLPTGASPHCLLHCRNAPKRSLSPAGHLSHCLYLDFRASPPAAALHTHPNLTSQLHFPLFSLFFFVSAFQYSPPHYGFVRFSKINTAVTITLRRCGMAAAAQGGCGMGGTPYFNGVFPFLLPHAGGSMGAFPPHPPKSHSERQFPPPRGYPSPSCALSAIAQRCPGAVGGFRGVRGRRGVSALSPPCPGMCLLILNRPGGTSSRAHFLAKK